MKRLKPILMFGSPAIGALTKLIELSKTPALVDNPEKKELISHLLWLGNVFGYIGIPLTVIYLIVKVFEI